MKFQIVRIVFLLLVALSFFTLEINHAIIVSAILGAFFGFTIFVGSASIQANFFIKSINNARDNRVVLTFDDGPHKEHTASILDILKKHNIKANFFVIGKEVEENEGLIKRMHDEGHIIGNHSYHHRNMMGIQTARSIVNEIDLTNSLIQKITGETPALYRPPFGVTNPKIARAIKASNMTSVGWNLRSKDTTFSDPKKLLEKLITLTDKKGVVVLLHDRCKVTADILEQYIEHCLKEGMKFDTIKA